MSLAALERLQACHEALIGALDANDVDAVEASVARFRGAVDEVRAAGGWRDNADVKGRAARIALLADAARIRVNFLTDLTSRRIEALETVRGGAASARYGRDGALVR